MKKYFFIILFVLSVLNIGTAGVLMVDDFESYASSSELSSVYSPGDWHASVKLNLNDDYGKSMRINYNSISWGTYVTRKFLTPYNLENYRGIIVYLKGDGSNNTFKLQIKESSLSGNLDGEAWEQNTGISLSYQGYNSYFIKFSDLSVTSGTKKSGVLDLSSISELSFLVYKNSSSINGSFYVDKIKFVPETVAETFPHNNVKINVPDKVKIFLNLKLNPSTYTNYISVKENGTAVSGSYSYDINDNIITFTPAASFNVNKTYTINFSPNLELSGTEELNISALDGGMTNTFYTVSDLSYGSEGGYLQDKNTGIIVGIPYNAVNSSSKVELQSYSGSEFLNKSYLCPAGVKIISDSALLKPLTLMVYKDYFYSQYPSFSGKNISFYSYNSGWNAVAGTGTDGFIKSGIRSTGIFGVGEYKTGDNNILYDVRLSSNPFTPNNDGKNDDVKIYFSISKSCLVNIEIYDNNGVKVKSVITDKSLEAGNYFYKWDGTNLTETIVKPDFYIYRISAVYTESGKSKEIIKRGVISVLY